MRASDFLEDLPDSEAKLFSDRLQVFLPGGAVDGVDTFVLELHHGLIRDSLGEVRDVSDEAWSQMDDLVQVFGMERVLDMR